MITVQVRNKNIMNLVVIEMGMSELQLGTFPAVNEEKLATYRQHLSRR